MKKEWEKSHSTQQPPQQQQTQQQQPPATEQKQLELPDDVKAKLEEFEKFKKEFEAKEQEEKQKQIVTEKRKKLSDLIKRPEAGMPNELLRNIIFENIQISPEEEDTSILLKIQGKYNETCTKYTKDGINPFISDKGGSSDVKSFIDRKREEDKANKENNIVSRYYSKINKTAHFCYNYRKTGGLFGYNIQTISRKDPFRRRGMRFRAPRREQPQPSLCRDCPQCRVSCGNISPERDPLRPRKRPSCPPE